MTMRIDVSGTADLPPSLREAVLLTSKATFSGGVYSLERVIEGDWQVTVWEDDTWVSVQQIFQRTVDVGGKLIPVAGLGNLLTLPEWRNYGYGTRVFIRALTFIREHLTCKYALMFCAGDWGMKFERLGWQLLKAPVTCSQPSGPYILNRDFHTLVSCLGEQDWPQGAIDLRGLPW